MKFKSRLNTILPVAILLIAAGCSTSPVASDIPEISSRDTLDSTLWSSYYSNGVGIIKFEKGKYTERFYDGITAKSDQSTRAYHVIGNRIEISEPDSSQTIIWFEIGKDGKELAIFSDSLAAAEHRPNIVFTRY